MLLYSLGYSNVTRDLQGFFTTMPTCHPTSTRHCFLSSFRVFRRCHPCWRRRPLAEPFLGDPCAPFSRRLTTQRPSFRWSCLPSERFEPARKEAGPSYTWKKNPQNWWRSVITSYRGSHIAFSCEVRTAWHENNLATHWFIDWIESTLNKI